MRKNNPYPIQQSAKRAAPLFALFTLGTSSLHALVVNVDFDKNAGALFTGQGAHADSGNNFWNSSRNSMSDLTASDGVTATTIDLAVSAGGRFDAIGGNVPAGQSHSQLVGDYAYAGGGDITVDITGLGPNDPYRLYLYCQGDQLSQKATVTFPGSSSVSTTGRLDGTIAEGENYVVIDVTANSSGAISGTVARNGSNYVALNGVQIVELGEPMVFAHPGCTVTVADLDHVKSKITMEPWKTGYEELTSSNSASLTYTMQGPFASVGHTAAENRNAWRADMIAAHHLARRWYMTDDAAYAQKARDILISWANTHTTFLPGETYLDMGYHAHDVFGAAEILRGAWSGWSQADTDTFKTYVENVWWNSGRLDVPGPLRAANQGMAQFTAALGAAVFLDDEEKFNQCLHIFRSDAPAALLSSLPNGQIGDTGRDSHAQGQLMLMAWCAEVFWTQGVDVYSDHDNRLLAAMEYMARYNLLAETPFIQAGTVYDIYPEIHTFDDEYANWHFESKMITLLYNAYVVRKGMSAPYLEKYLSYAPQKESSFCFLNTVDNSTATALPPVQGPADVATVTSLNNTNMGDAVGGSTSYSNGTWTVSGQGSNLWFSSEPDYQFAYLPVTGDATIIAKITSFAGGGDVSARAGLVFTESLSNGDTMGAVAFTAPGATDDLDCFYRGQTASSHNASVHGKPNQARPRLPYWLKIERIGDRVNFFNSPDGASWSCAGSADYDLADTAYYGLAVCAENNNGVATATFTNVQITGGDGGEPEQVPPAPFAIYASPGGDEVPLRWLESFQADSYKIWRSTQSGGPYTLIAQETGTSYIDTNVNYGTHYYYAVSAVNAIGESPLSPEDRFWLPDTSWYEAEDYDAQSGVQTEDTIDFFGGRNVGWIGTGDWTRYDGITVNSGAVFKARIAGMNAEVGQIEVRSGSPTGTLLGVVDAIHTGGAQKWGTVETSLSGPTGVHDLCLVFTNGTASAPGFNLNWFDITYPALTDFDLGMAQALTLDPAAHALTNLGSIPNWDATTAHLQLQDGSDLTGVDFAALGLTSWTTNDFGSSATTTWDGANLNGLILHAGGNFGAGDSFTGADFSNLVWGSATSSASLFGGGSGASSAANQDEALNLSGADFSLVTGSARSTMINNLGGFDGATPIGAKFDPVFIANSGWDANAMVAAGWQFQVVNAFALIEAENYDDQSGVDTQTSSEGGLNVQGIQNGDWAAYHNVDFGSGADEFQARVASATSGGNIEIRLGSPTGTLVGTCAVSNTTGWQNWTTVTTNVTGLSGIHDVYLVFTGGAGYLFNLNWFTFSTSFTLSYTAGTGGSISGTSPQVVNSGSDGTAVTAVADSGYAFVDWSDGSTNNPRIDVGVSSDLSVTANFELQVAPNDLVAHWTMNDGSGSTVSDDSGYGLDATLANASWTSGINGGALDFNGTSSTVTLPVTAFSSISDEITVAMWAYGGATQPQNNSIFYAVDSSGNRVINVHLPWSNGTVYWDAGFSGGYDRINKLATTAESKDQWNHWVFTKNATTGDMSIYLNGSLWHSGTGKVRTISGIANARLGSQISGVHYDGSIDDVRLYNYSLNATEVANLTNSYTVINGVPVSWLVSYGIDPTDAGALADTDNDGLANWEEYAQGKDPLVSDNPAGIRVNEYYLTTGDFSGTTATVNLNQALADDYYILVRGSRTGSGLSLPNNDYARVTAVPSGTGDLANSGSTTQITLSRAVADFDWEGVVTVVECTNSSSPSGFKLVDVLSTTLTGTSGTDSSASWSDLNQVVLFGGYRGGGASFVGTPTSRNQGTSVYTNLTPSESGTLNWSRNAGGETLVDATMTTFVIEWGSDWNVQRVNVSGSAGGNGADVVGEYTTAAISSVNRDNTWLWATGTRADAGIGDCAEACLVTLGDGVNQNATESTVAVGSEYTDAYNFDVYVMSHSGLAVDHRFKVDGDTGSTDLAVAVDTAASGTRMGWVYNGCNGTGTYFSRPRLWARYTADGEITISRGFSGQNFPAWVQGIDFSGVGE